MTSEEKVGSETRREEERVTRRKPIPGGQDEPGQEPLPGSSPLPGGTLPIHVPPLASPWGRVFPLLNPKSLLESTLPSMMVGSGKEEPSLAKTSDKKRNTLIRNGFVVVLNKRVF